MSATDLWQAYNPMLGGGRWSFTLRDVPDDAFVTADLLSMTMEAPTAQPWVIQLSAFQYSGGGSAIDPTYPARNQVDSRQLFARVTWAVDGAQEVADVDYRTSGGTIQVTASMIRVALGSLTTRNPGSNRPTVAGSLSPGLRTCGVAPTYTTPYQTALAGGNSAVFPIPPRACAYRWLTATLSPLVQPTLANMPLDEYQGDIVQQTVGQTPALDTTGGLDVYLMSNRAKWYVPHPQSAFIKIRNDGASNVPVAIQFLLDLG